MKRQALGTSMFATSQSSSTPLLVFTCVKKGVLGEGGNSEGNAFAWFLHSFPHPRPGHAPKCKCLQSFPVWRMLASILASQVCLQKRVRIYDFSVRADMNVHYCKFANRGACQDKCMH